MNEIGTAVIVGVASFVVGIFVGLLAARIRRLRRGRSEPKGLGAPRRRWWKKRRPEIEEDATLMDEDATLIESAALTIESDPTITLSDEVRVRAGLRPSAPRRSREPRDGAPAALEDDRSRLPSSALPALRETSASPTERVPAPLTQCRMTLPNGKGVTYTIEDGYTWAVADTDGLAVDMHVRIAPGGARFISVRTENPQASLDAAGARLQLSTVEIPWRNGKIANGSLTFDLVPPPPPPWELQKPGNPTNFHAFATDSCVVVTRDQPHLATLAATLWVPGGVDALGAWRDRLNTYLERLNQRGGSQLLLVALDQDGLVFSGGLLPEIGLGGANDSVPSVVHRTVDPVRLQRWQRKIWIPTSGSEQRWHWDSFTVVLPQ